jgi:ABC-type dipeptide/oligopeptide/nickel transport system permease subunit
VWKPLRSSARSIFLVALAVTLLGDGLSDALDPRER